MRASGRTPKQWVLRVVGSAASALAILVMLASVAFIAPSLFGFERYVITGGSMSGTFEKGSVVFEDVVPVHDLRVGDVVTYLPPASTGLDSLVTHRLVNISARQDGTLRYHTKGDANPAADPWSFELNDSLQPRATFSVPLVGYVFLAMNDRDTRMLLIGIPAGVIALFSLYELLLALRPERAPSAAAAGAAGDSPSADLLEPMSV